VRLALHHHNPNEVMLSQRSTMMRSEYYVDKYDGHVLSDETLATWP
jgi:hypothetical protein